MTGNEVRIDVGPCIRQQCRICYGETWKHPVQAYVFVPGTAHAVGAICEGCLQARTAEDFGVPSLPTLATLTRARAAYDRLDAGMGPGDLSRPSSPDRGAGLCV